MIAKLQYINQTVNPNGGINFVVRELKKAGVDKLIDRKLGERPKQCRYKYSDVLLGWVYSNFCGAERLEDTAKLKQDFKGTPDIKLPCSDRIAQIFKQLSTANFKIPNTENSTGNINWPLNNLLMDIVLKLKLLDTKTNYTLDYDALVVGANKYDCEYTYKKHKGYVPVVSFLGQIPVYIEGRSGNCSPYANMEQSLERTLDILKKKNIKVKQFRSDAAAFQKSVIRLMDREKINFFIRAKNTDLIIERIPEHKWQKIEFNYIDYEIAESKYRFHNDNKSYRLVVTRRKEITKEGREIIIARAIVTSDTTMTSEQVVCFYNQRGNMERNFDDLLNNFNWKRMPFSFLNQNTTFWLISAISNILYRYIITTFSKRYSIVKENFRLKKFIFEFICVAALWQNGKLCLHTKRDYGKYIG